MSKIFICHAEEDLPFLQEDLFGLIDALGLDYWYSEESVTRGVFDTAIVNALQEADWILLVMSPHSCASPYVKGEVIWTLDNKPAQLIALRISDCKPEEIHLRLLGFQYIDFTRNKKAAREKLIRDLVQREYHGYDRKAHREDLRKIQESLGTILSITQRDDELHTRCLSCRNYCANSDLTLNIGKIDSPEWTVIRTRETILSKTKEMLADAPESAEISYITNGLNVPPEIVRYFVDRFRGKNFRIIHNRPVTNEWKTMFQIIAEDSARVLHAPTGGVRLLLIRGKCGFICNSCALTDGGTAEDYIALYTTYERNLKMMKILFDHYWSQGVTRNKRVQRAGKSSNGAKHTAKRPRARR
jgi:hypothetical protein